MPLYGPVQGLSGAFGGQLWSGWSPGPGRDGTSSPSSEKLSLGLQLKHCEDPVVIDDGDSPLDQEQEQLPVEPHSDLAKSQDAQPIALAQCLGLPSRAPSQLSGDPGMQPGE